MLLDLAKMTGGDAFLAYPAAYRVSGVMTFMINQDGVLVQKDLGLDTVKLASEITEYPIPTRLGIRISKVVRHPLCRPR